MTAGEVALFYLAVLLAGSTLTFGLLWGRRTSSAPGPAAPGAPDEHHP
ncbi:hypothetical protein GA0070616_4405 [Micromonospora nigra]|uniref:Uncharacterized protein n=1 Tax=Micromonospora nigra TaxID=145857 RepID=A0A1C6SSP7_9ACTN|nr:hypothetical protein [Micromonospora nigra]SCL32195.1 hypothetical protein GA0070616_4405 [Micromonospora nigra]